LGQKQTIGLREHDVRFGAISQTSDCYVIEHIFLG
jgi:hypothetical protein